MRPTLASSEIRPAAAVRGELEAAGQSLHLAFQAGLRGEPDSGVEEVHVAPSDRAAELRVGAVAEAPVEPPRGPFDHRYLHRRGARQLRSPVHRDLRAREIAGRGQPAHVHVDLFPAVGLARAKRRQIEDRFRRVARQSLDRDRAEGENGTVIELDLEVGAACFGIDRRPALGDGGGCVALISEDLQRVLLGRLPRALAEHLAGRQSPARAHAIRETLVGLFAKADRDLANAHRVAGLDRHPHDAFRAVSFDPGLDPCREKPLRGGDITGFVARVRYQRVEQFRRQVLVALPARELQVARQDPFQCAGGLDHQPEFEGAALLRRVQLNAERARNRAQQERDGRPQDRSQTQHG